MNNSERRQLLNRFRASGMEGSILDVFDAYNKGVDLISQHYAQQNQQEPAVLQTPQEQQEGLRPFHAAGDIKRSAVFKDVPPNTPFNTHGMKVPINIEKYNEQGHLVESHKSVPPGISNIPTGPYKGDVVETPAEGYRDGGFLQKGGTVKRGRKKHARSSREYAHHVKGQPEGTKSTHLMATYEGDGKYYVAPTITTNKEGYKEQSFQEAFDAREVYEFNNKKRAERFAKGSWKKKKQKGGQREESQDAIASAQARQSLLANYVPKEQGEIRQDNSTTMGQKALTAASFIPGVGEVLDLANIPYTAVTGKDMYSGQPGSVAEAAAWGIGGLLLPNVVDKSAKALYKTAKTAANAGGDKVVKKALRDSNFTEGAPAKLGKVPDGDYDAVKSIQQHVTNTIRRKGEKLDELGFNPSDLTMENIMRKGMTSPGSGRHVVEVDLGNGMSQHFYLSTSLGGKTPIGGGTSKGMWVPYEGTADLGEDVLIGGKIDDWVVKAEGWDHGYGSKTMYDVSTKVGDLLKNEGFVQDVLRSYQKGGFIQADVNGESQWMRADGSDPSLRSEDIANYLSSPNEDYPDRSLLSPEQWQATGDTIAFHESGPGQRMDPRAVQKVTDKVEGSKTKGQKIDGPAKGMFQFETGPTKRFPKAQESWQTGVQRTVNILKEQGYPDEVIAEWRASVPEDPRDASEDMQRMIYLSNIAKGGGDTQAYARGDIPLAELWAKGHKIIYDESDLKSFEESREAAKTELPKYGLRLGGVRYSKRRYKK